MNIVESFGGQSYNYSISDTRNVSMAWLNWTVFAEIFWFVGDDLINKWLIVFSQILAKTT